MLQERKGYARSVDIAAGLGVTKPSVSVAMKKLRENGYINMEADNTISLKFSKRHGTSEKPCWADQLSTGPGTLAGPRMDRPAQFPPSDIILNISPPNRRHPVKPCSGRFCFSCRTP